MTAIEAAVKTVSDLHDFYRRIPKLNGRKAEAARDRNAMVQRTPQRRRG
jgi:hypothetical protein